MPLPRRDNERHTYGEYRTWPEDERYELIDGIAYAMSAAPTRVHQETLGEIYRQIADGLENGPCRAFVAPFDVRLPEADEEDDGVGTVVQPDITVVCDESKLDDKGCRGAPDWVLEILSTGTAAHDQILKRSLYERHGVNEYWLVHPTDRLVTVYRLEDGGYGKPMIHEMVGELAAGGLPNVNVRWDRITRRLAPL